ncbi:hypothetical protein I7X12_13895 [Halosimplex litoreum]|uniref:RING-type E3 ubiquitin transferase n=1 Tax=Halosimplex litoreum TaxID=1198301 RepID=A0A7T3FWK8_9EURY|nr:GIDE domain-containing protein [Halosimplex litoreum]QPV61837.1 hypothetical protein I7X12_13895 [Halosimplex litoreum]
MRIDAEAVGSALLVGLTLTLSCSWFLYRGWRFRRRARRVRETPSETLATARPGDTVVVTGTASGRDGAVTGPLSGERGVLAAWLVEEWHNVFSRFWSSKARGIRTASFEVDAGERTVAVRARTADGPAGLWDGVNGDDALVGLATEDVRVEVDSFGTDTEIAAAADRPGRFRDLEREVGLDDAENEAVFDVGRTDGTRRYRESVLETGEEVTVRGTLAAPDDAGDPPVVTPPDDGRLLVSTLSAAALSRRYRRSYWKLFYGPLALVASCTLLVGLVMSL